MEYLHYFNLLLGISGIVLQILCITAILSLFFGPQKNKYLLFVKEHFLLIGLLISMAGVLSSLFYSNIIGFIPCYLCWWQRIFLYPSFILFGLAYFKKDRNISYYIFPLLVLGSLVSIYHNFFYYFGEGTAPCDASGVSCVQALVSEFGGYISIPSLALTSFVSLLVLLAVAHFYKSED